MASAESLSDDFNDNSRDAAKWAGSYSSSSALSETGGQAVVTLPNATVGSNYAGYNTAPTTYDLTNSYIAAQVTVANTATNTQVILKCYADASNQLYMMEQLGTLHFQKNVAGAGVVDVASTAYNATQHAWWRISESGGTIYWHTSINGKSWVQKASLANPFAVTAVTIELSAGTFQSETAPGAALFDNFNLLPYGGSASTSIGNNNYTSISAGDGMSVSEKIR